MSNLAIGIYLGSTTSSIAIYRNGKPEAILDSDTKTPFVPSLIAINKNGKLLVGESAREFVDLPGCGVREVKRKMGKGEIITLGDKVYHPEELSAVILDKLKRNAEIMLGEKVTDIVLSVPANFNDAAKQATLHAAELAGLKVIQLINEPTAAALAFGIENIEPEAQVIVFDFGGSTLDVSTLEMIDGVLEVTGSYGDTQLGGKDFDDAMTNMILRKFYHEHGKVQISDKSQGMLKTIAENAIITLSSHYSYEVSVNYFATKGDGFVDLDVEVTRSEFEREIEPLLIRVRECLTKAMREGKSKPSVIDTVIMVGGTTYIPCVRNIVEDFFGKHIMEIDPELAVVLGAATLAGIKKGLTGKGCNTMAYEYYDFLGINHFADKDDINRACKRKRRELTIDEDNAGLQYLNQIQQTLLDDHSRASYDEMQEYGDNITELLNNASEQMEAEEWKDATRSLKQLLALAPKQVVARNLLGICYTREGKYDEAIKIYDKLLVECPDKPLYWVNAGNIYSKKSSAYPVRLSDGQLKSECPYCEEINYFTDKNNSFVYECEHCQKLYLVPEETKDVWLTKSRKCYLKAIELEPYNHELYINIADTYIMERNYYLAIEWAEKGINADGKVNFDDFDHLFLICKIYSFMRQFDKMIETAERVELLVADDIDEVREYAAYRFFKYSHELSKIKIFSVAACFAKCALIINPDDEDINTLYEYYDSIACAEYEYEKLTDDSNIINPMKRLATLSLAIACEDEVEDKDEIFTDILNEFKTFSDSYFMYSLNRLKNLYNGIYRLDKEFYDQF